MPEQPYIRLVDERYEALLHDVGILKHGDGDGTSGGMEARIAKLEAQMEGVRSELNKLSSVPVDLARVDERVKHLPGKGFVVTTTTTSLALLAAIILFADKLRAIIAG